MTLLILFLYCSICSSQWAFRFRLRVLCMDCLVLWAGPSSSNIKGDYLSVAISSTGYIEISYNLGGGDYRLLYQYIRVNDSDWHTVRLNRYPHVVSISYLKYPERTTETCPCAYNHSG